MRRFTIRFSDSPVPLIYVCEGDVVVQALYGITPQHALNRAVKWMRANGGQR